MTAQHGDELVGVYMARLGAALAGLPPESRDEIAGEIANHIAEERAGLSAESDADLQSLLERVGDPIEIAAAADVQVTSAAAARTWGGLEVAALVLIPLFWPVGVILLWLSSAWRVRDKVIGTVLPPVGFLGFALAGPAALLGGGGGSCVTESDSAGNVIYQSCTGVAALPGWVQALLGVAALAGIAVLLVMPVLVAIYLAIRLRRGANKRRAHNAGRDERTSWTGGSAAIS